MHIQRTHLPWILVAVLTAGIIAIPVSIQRCFENLKCITSFQYAYLAGLNESLTKYPSDVYACFSRGNAHLTEFLSLEDSTNQTIQCRKIDKGQEGIVTRIMRADQQ